MGTHENDLAAVFGGAGAAAKKGPKTAEEEAKEAAEKQKAEQERMARVAEGLSAVGGDSRVSGSQLGQLFSLHADDISQATDGAAVLGFALFLPMIVI